MILTVEGAMDRIYKAAEYLHEKLHIHTRTAFFLCTISGAFLAGLLLMTAAVGITGKIGEACITDILTGALYMAAGFGFFGSIIYLMRK